MNKSAEQSSIEKIIEKYIQDIKRNNAKQKIIKIPDETPVMPSIEPQEVSISSLSFPEELNKGDNYSPDYAPESPASNQGMNINININSQPSDINKNQGINIDVPQQQVSPDYAPLSPASNQGQVSPDYAPLSPASNQGILEVEPVPEEKELSDVSSSNDNKKIIISSEENKDSTTNSNSDVKKINI